VDISDTAEFVQYRLILTSTATPAPSVSQLTLTVAPTFLYGDLNGDKVVNILDAVTALRITARLITPTDAQKAAGDVAPKPGTGGRALGDGVLNVLDAVRILRTVAKLDSLP
jgi:hypothetical protein